MYYGRGAGMMPTAVAVVSDVIEVARNLLVVVVGRRAAARRRPAARWRERRIRDSGELESRYYLRFGVVDKPGVLAQLAGILGEHAISISEVVQEGAAPGGPAGHRRGDHAPRAREERAGGARRHQSAADGASSRRACSGSSNDAETAS